MKQAVNGNGLQGDVIKGCLRAHSPAGLWIETGIASSGVMQAEGELELQLWEELAAHTGIAGIAGQGRVGE